MSDVVILRPPRPRAATDAAARGAEPRPQAGPALFDHAEPDATSNQAGDAGNGFLYGAAASRWRGWAGRANLVGAEVNSACGPAPEGRHREGARGHRLRPSRSPGGGTLFGPLADPASLAVTVRKAGTLRGRRRRISRSALDKRGSRSPPAEGFGPGAFTRWSIREGSGRARLGFAAVRDVVTFLRRDGRGAKTRWVEGRPSCIGPRLRHVAVGRFVRDFLYLGFNEDTAGRAVFDGLMPHVAGSRRLSTNSRWARPGQARGIRRTRPVRRKLPVRLSETGRSVAGTTGRAAAALHADQHLPEGDADGHRTRMVGVACFAGGDGPGGGTTSTCRRACALTW